MGDAPSKRTSSDSGNPAKNNSGDSTENSALEPIFHPWLDSFVRLLAPLGAFGGLYVVVLFAYGASPKTLNVGYMPTQPVPYSHALHAGQMGIDCRYCHTSVESQPHANIPPTQTCNNCHDKTSGVHPESEKLWAVRESVFTGLPVPWTRVHDLPDYVYFNHSAHVNKGVGCVECHGRVDKMEVVFQDQPLSMGWCLDCHRDPGPRLRPLDKITDMNWKSQDPELGARLKDEYGIRNVQYMTSCSTCHR